MAVVNANEMLIRATKERYAVGAFNVTNLIQMEAVVEAACEREAPLILQTSVTPSRFLGPRVLAAVYRALAEPAPIPICLHLDHCTDVEYCKVCVDAGYTNIMIDASKHPLPENIRQTREVAHYAHRVGDITVEGELGTVSGVEDQVKVVALVERDVSQRGGWRVADRLQGRAGRVQRTVPDQDVQVGHPAVLGPRVDRPAQRRALQCQAVDACGIQRLQCAEQLEGQQRVAPPEGPDLVADRIREDLQSRAGREQREDGRRDLLLQ